MPERILLIKLSALGDVIHTLPFLEALRAVYPQGHITWLVEEAAAPLLQDHPALDEVWVSRRQSWLQAGKNGLFRRRVRRELLAFIRQVRVPAFDLVIDLQGLLKSAMWVALSRSPRKIGYNKTREFSYLALNERLPAFDPEAHAVWRYLEVAHYLGAPPAAPHFRLSLTDEIGGWLTPLWKDLPGPLLVIHPGTRWPTKGWPGKKFAQLADRLIIEFQARVVFTGSSGDRRLIARIKDNMHNKALDLSGRTNLKELARLFQKADLAITTDTGPMHLAAALQKPVVALFGPTAPWRTGPFGEGHQAIRLGLKCSPCYQRQCRQPECMTGIEVEPVLTAVKRILSGYDEFQ
jgi:heptosyltransferase I